MPESAHNKTELGLYIHLPFCPSRCPYCDFYALPFEAALAGRLIPALIKHLEGIAPSARGRRLDTVYIGGGTPSMLPLAWLGRILKTLRDELGIRPGAEVSLEANPGTLSRRKLDGLLKLGINRLSLGAQSLNPASLKALGRLHGRAETVRAVRQARAAGFANLNLDIIYGLPHQTGSQAVADLDSALELTPDHISLYELTLAPDTVFGRKYAYGKAPLPHPDELARFEQKAFEHLQRAGLGRYEVSNFARPGHECRHNQSTWRGGEYLALGPGAHGHLAGRRWAWISDAALYSKTVQKGLEPLDFEEKLSREDMALERIMLGLRTVEGVNLSDMFGALGVDARKMWPGALKSLQEFGWARISHTHIKPTFLGLGMADGAARLFM